MTESITADIASAASAAAPATAQAAPAVQEAPAAAGPAPVPASESVPATEAPAAPEATPAASVAPQEAAPAEPAKTTLLTESEKLAEAKPAEKSAEPEKPAELPPVTYEPFTLPEGVTMGGDRLDAFRAVLGEQRVDQAHAQKLVDMHVAEVMQAQAAWREQQSKAWIDANAGWIEQAKNDPEIGGNRFETSLTAAKTLLGQLMRTPEEKAELQQVLSMTGAGNHPIIIKAFARAATMMREGAPLATTQPTQKLSPAQRRYTTSTGS